MNYSLSKYFKGLIYLSGVIILSINNVIAQKIEGYVFIDSNKNSVMDNNEIGLGNVKVSNQKDVLITNDEGYFQIKLIEGNFIMVTKPESYQFKLDEYNNPEFYFLYKTRNTREDLAYPGSEPLSEIPEVLYFPVYENLGEEEHSCLLMGDPQMKSEKKLNYYVEGIIPHLDAVKADFYVELGDIAHNKLDILLKEKQVNATLGIPGYRVLGNHDMNFRATSNKNARETFKKTYGPDYYSFDYGNFHYIVLNSVIYKGWWDDVNAPGTYFGGLTPQQIRWLENDLLQTPAHKTIVLLSHIPLHDDFITKTSMRNVLKALGNHKKILAVSGHLHSVIAYDYTVDHGWDNSQEFEGLVAGAVCGSWWSGPKDLNGIPFSTCEDGSPKGFFKLNAENENYNYVFHPINYPSDYQMKTYIQNNEIWVNWFVGKRTDSVWVHFDNNPKDIYMENFITKDPYMVSRFESRKNMDKQLKSISNTGHMWKTKIPEDLSSGYHSVKIFAKDSNGKLYYGFKTFLIE